MERGRTPECTREWFCLCEVPLRVVAYCANRDERGARRQTARTDDAVIVEGDDASRDILERALHGYTVVTVLDGVDGLTRARRCCPAALVTDERLTGLSGVSRDRGDPSGVPQTHTPSC